MILYIYVTEDYLLKYSVNLEFQNLNTSCCREIKLVLKYKYSYRENYFGMLSSTKTAIIKQQLQVCWKSGISKTDKTTYICVSRYRSILWSFVHQRNFINIYCFLVPSFNALLLNRSMHFNSHHLCQHSPCVFYPQYSVPTQLSPELWWADLTSANRAAGRERQLSGRGQQSCFGRGWGIFLLQKYYRNINHPK